MIGTMTGLTPFRQFRVRFVTLIPVLFLAACSGGTDAPPVQLQILEAGRAAIAAQGAPATPRPEMTRALLDTVTVPLLEVTRERTGQVAYLYLSLARRDGSPGRINVWRTQDDASLATRGGVLIATRGLGGDVLSSAVALRATAPGPVTGERVQYIRALDNKELRLALTCTVTDLGPAGIEIVGRRHATRHLRERCEGGGGSVVNDYWVDSRAGLIWQSRQWAGPQIGYLRLRRLTR